MIKLTEKEAIDKLFYDDLDSIITGNQSGDNSYLWDILSEGFKGYYSYTRLELQKELNERHEAISFEKI